MKPKLIILTKHYPFGTGEPFVGNEVQILKDVFDIHIIADSYVDAPSRIADDESIKVSRVPKFDWPNRAERKKALCLCLSSFPLLKEVFNVILKYKTKSGDYLRDILNQVAFGEKYYSYLIDNGLININEPAIIYSFWNVYKLSPFLLRKKKNTNLRLVSRIHRVDIYNDAHPSGRQPLKSLNVRLDRFYFLAQSAYEYYVDNFGKLPKNCGKVFPLGSFNNLEIKENKEKHDKFILLTCSRVVKVKRLERIVRALELINDIQIEWIHFGDGELMESLRDEINAKLNKDNIKVTLMGDVENSKIFSYYNDICADCFLNVSESEGTPVSIMEALSFGIPVIAYDCGSIPEMLNGTDNILMPQDSSAEDLATAIRKMYNMSDLEKKNLRTNNRNLWNERYNGEVNTKKMTEDMLGLLG